MADFIPLMGYTPDRAGTDAFLSTLARPTLAQAGPDLVLDETRDVNLGQYLLKVAPDWKRGAQKIGSCTGWGWGLSVDILAACDVLLRNEPESYGGRVLEASIYAFSRCEVRGGRNLGGDGSYGGACAKAVTNYGTLHYGINYDGVTFTDNSGQREKEWGRDGVPDRLEPFAAKHKVSSVALVRSFEDCARALQNGYPTAVCSGMGFSMTLRHGYMTPMGSWSHCQMACAVKWKPEPAILVVNSWADCYGGTYDESLPTQFQRSAGWVRAKDFTRMVQGEDSFCLSGYSGFPPRVLPDWTGGVL